MGRLLSVNVGLPSDISWRGETVRTSVWKNPVQDRLSLSIPEAAEAMLVLGRPGWSFGWLNEGGSPLGSRSGRGSRRLRSQSERRRGRILLR